jgi:DNA-binding Lrp family transcriptional regulator
MPSLDALDRRLLRVHQENCLLSADELADRCGTSASTALRRLKRLRRTGVIRAEVAVVDGPRVGRGLLLLVSVRLEREDERGVRAFVERIAAHPDVTQFYFVTGTTDYVIMLSVRGMEDYDRFLQETLVTDPLVIMTDTNVVIRPLKMGLAVPIDEAAVD